jgi:hypothetical protein
MQVPSPVRLLPYSLVPGILHTSPLFFKAVSVIAKQQSTAAATSDSTAAFNAPAAFISKGKKKNHPGKFVSLSYSFSYKLKRLLDPLSKFLNGSDVDLVARARDVVTNSIMAEITKEDPQGHAEYQDAVRHQVVATFQRLRLHVLVLDTLMEAYKASH